MYIVICCRKITLINLIYNNHLGLSFFSRQRLIIYEHCWYNVTNIPFLDIAIEKQVEEEEIARDENNLGKLMGDSKNFKPVGKYSKLTDKVSISKLIVHICTPDMISNLYVRV